MLSQIQFRNFKSLKSFSLNLQKVNVLVGPNNSGKSTVLDGFRALAGAFRFARRRIPKTVFVKGNEEIGFSIPESSIPINLTNIRTDYVYEDSEILFSLSNGNQLKLWFPTEKEPILYVEKGQRAYSSINQFYKQFPIEIGVIPTLGPFEEIEPIRDEAYVRKNLLSRRAHRLFRNIWRLNDFQQFEEFSKELTKTWEGIEIHPPEISGYGEDSQINMFFSENRIDREVFWAGYGFQVWLQIITHLINANPKGILIIDEPDIYLHSDLQKRLFALLKDKFSQIILATHSVEIINEAESNEIVVIEKNLKAGRRISDVTGVQEALDLLGSEQNVALSRLSKGRKIIFFEGNDFKLIRRFALKLGLENLAAALNFSVLKLGGFNQSNRIENIVWTFEQILKTDVQVATLLDRDYRPNEDVEEFLNSLKTKCKSNFCFVTKRKEIENYLLDLEAIEKTLNQKYENKKNKKKFKKPTLKKTIQIVNETAEYFKPLVLSQISIRKTHSKNRDRHLSDETVIQNCITEFEKNWPSLDFKIRILPGKDFLSKLNENFQNEFGVSVTAAGIITNYKKENISQDLKQILENLEAFANN